MSAERWGSYLYHDDISSRWIGQLESILVTVRCRSTACTKMNSASSRSHLVLTLTVRGVDKVTEEETVGKLRMVDLAGCERIAKSGATGKQLTEANAINKSLSSLGQVFIGLRQGDKHIPFRNSKLTHLLQDSLGGQSKTCFFVNISPSESNLQETMSTLEFGSVSADDDNPSCSPCSQASAANPCHPMLDLHYSC